MDASPNREYLDSPKRSPKPFTSSSSPIPDHSEMLKSTPNKKPVSAPPYTLPTLDTGAPLPTPHPTIRRRLHIPARGGTVLYGFHASPILTDANVSEEQWHLFTKDIQNLINPQRPLENTVYTLLGVTMVTIGGVAIFGIITYLYYGSCKQECRRRFDDAKASGVLDLYLKRWNTGYFEPRGLKASVEPPDSSASAANLLADDINDRKFARNYWKNGTSYGPEDMASSGSSRWKARARSREQRVKEHAAKRFRIVMEPCPVRPLESSLQAQQASGVVQTPSSV